MYDLKFSYNWNKKLDCHAFTAIRRFNPFHHIPGNCVNIILKEEKIGTGKIESVKRMKLQQITSYISYLDTGYSVEQCQNILRKMYPNANWEIQELAFILIVKSKD